MTTLRIGLLFETFETYARREGDPPDAHAEYEPEATIAGLERAIEILGHQPVRIGAPRDLLAALAPGTPPPIDCALNIAEGHGGRNREAWAPILLELAGIPTLGSDALTLSTTLDKAWANDRVAGAGLDVAARCVIDSAEAAASTTLPAPFPLFVKPRWEGTAKGIRASSRVETREALVEEVRRVVGDYAQPALVEAFVPGPEYTVTVVGNRPPRAWPALQRALEVETGIGLHALEPGADRPLEHHTPGQLDAALEARLEAFALDVYHLFECRDFARVDFRLDASGTPIFLEINPLPTFAPDGTFGILAELFGRPFEDVIAECIQEGLKRLGLSPAAPASDAFEGDGEDRVHARSPARDETGTPLKRVGR